MEVNIVIPISRKYFLSDLFKSLDMLICDVNKTSIFIYIDGDLTLYEQAKKLLNQSKYIDKKIVYRNRGIGSVGSVHRRRQRIADIHNEIRTLITESKYIFLIEDDTLVPPNSLNKLYEFYNKNDGVGLVSGIELGRWGYPINGAWTYNKEWGEISSWPARYTDDFYKITASGLYCCLIRFEHYIQNNFEPFEKILGPDYDLGLNLTITGLLNFINPSIQCEHLQIDNKQSLTYDMVKAIQIVYKKDSACPTGYNQIVIQ